MTNTNQPEVEVLPGEEVFLDAQLLAVLTGPKAKGMEILAGMRAEYEAAAETARELKARHDLLVDSARGLRKDYADVERIEKRGRKTAESEAEPDPKPE